MAWQPARPARGVSARREPASTRLGASSSGGWHRLAPLILELDADLAPIEVDAMQGLQSSGCRGPRVKVYEGAVGAAQELPARDHAVLPKGTYQPILIHSRAHLHTSFIFDHSGSLQPDVVAYKSCTVLGWSTGYDRGKATDLANP